MKILQAVLLTTALATSTIQEASALSLRTIRISPPGLVVASDCNLVPFLPSSYFSYGRVGRNVLRSTWDTGGEMTPPTDQTLAATKFHDVDRRSVCLSTLQILTIFNLLKNVSSVKAAAATDTQLDHQPILTTVTDPNTYEAIAYSPPRLPPRSSLPPPLIVVLHGAGKNDKPIMGDLGDPIGEHAGLIPNLIVASVQSTSSPVGVSSTAAAAAPSVLLDNFAVIAPYSYGKQSFYEEPRKKLLDFIDWAIENRNTDRLPIQFDPNTIILFGFSDGSTVAVELLTTRRFAAGVICSYGFSGKQLPPQALDRLVDIPVWVFHSRDDVIFDVSNSDRLVAQLRERNSSIRTGSSLLADGDEVQLDDIIRYSRYDSDPENLPRRIRGHSMGITASKSTELYDWLIAVTSKGRGQTNTRCHDADDKLFILEGASGLNQL